MSYWTSSGSLNVFWSHCKASLWSFDYVIFEISGFRNVSRYFQVFGRNMVWCSPNLLLIWLFNFFLLFMFSFIFSEFCGFLGILYFHCVLYFYLYVEGPRFKFRINTTLCEGRWLSYVEISANKWVVIEHLTAEQLYNVSVASLQVR